MYTLYSMQPLGQLLQGAAGAGAARHSATRSSRSTSSRARPARRNSSHEPQRPRAAAGGRARPLLAESNAILWYVAGGTPLAPEDRIERAEALQWMFFEQHSLEPNLGAAFFWLTLVKGGRELQQHALEDWMEEGYRALGVMEKHLDRDRFFAAGRYTIADIALYAYTHVAHACDFELAALSGGARLARPRRRPARPRRRWTGSRQARWPRQHDTLLAPP